MPPARKAKANPFYVLLMVVSTLFVITALGYLVGPYVERQAVDNPGAGPTAGSRALAAWFDRKGVVALAIEFAAMLALSVLAMSTDRYFSPKRPSTSERP
jgi:hypothetical protein